jgi:hypothetical protein
MSSAINRLRLSSLRAATLDEAGAVVPLPWLTAGTLTWPAAHAHRVLHGWREWLAASYDAPASSFRIRRAPRGAVTVSIEVAMPGEPYLAAGRLAPLRGLEPVTDTIGHAGPELLRPALTSVPAGYAPVTDHLSLVALPPEAADAFVAAAAPPARMELLSAELHHLGGTFRLAAVGAARGGEEAERVRNDLARLRRRMAPWAG